MLSCSAFTSIPILGHGAFGKARRHIGCSAAPKSQNWLKGLSPKTVRHIRGVLGTALGRAMKWNIVARNAAALTDAPRAVPVNIRAFDSDEARQFHRCGEAESASSEALHPLGGYARGCDAAKSWRSSGRMSISMPGWFT